jgi:peptidoglycan hydrolase-like protein with peptidoglycan-binding domain
MTIFTGSRVISTRVSRAAFAGVLALSLTASVASAATLNRQLELGMSGTDVSALQTFLASDATIYPQGLVTGYYGFLTKAAVSNFQNRNGIAAVGRVGPATLPVLNLQMGGGMNTSPASAPIISSVQTNAGRNAATIGWTTNESAKGLVYYSTSPLTTYEGQNSVNVSGSTAMTDTNFRNAQSVSLQNLQANTTYYYLIYTTDQTGNVSVTWPATFQTTN